uniref:Guanylate kinase-like domain-containing protein n=1 Tax=Arcella intermedia TaxID=1963864 RepID=A0A6B2LL24_9EUKA|eukprot:TRINITY_DN14_c0_g1_i1.p1 TRINITY_DN14_c0_g1~~TRINITY_DN14_c0_g1_i1.p1  ORF type:complete len:177 (-),score=56.27 TRINITY_DN14_c0_g1_i1:57-587(-)
MLLKEEPDKYSLTTSHTTRKPRPGEVHGVHYWFIEREQFLKDLAEGKFIEHNEYNGNLYGTSYAAVEAITKKGKTCLLDIDVNGAKKVKGSGLNARFFFILPPGADPFETLRKRLVGRGTDSVENVERRLGIAKGELQFFKENGTFFEHVIINGDLNEAFKQWNSFLSQSQMKSKL